MIGAVVFGVSASLERKRLAQNDTDIVLPRSTATASPAPKASATPSPKASATPTPTPTATPSLAVKVNLDVPFTAQAPFANWDEVHEETCEEASLLMAKWYVEGKKGEAVGEYSNRIPQQTAEDALLAMVEWQNRTFGYYKDTTVEETRRIAIEHLGIKNTRLLNNPTAADLKAELSKGNVIVMPAAGQELNNPYFTPPGPPYHMFVIRGYNEKGFIVNDPGTRRGEGFVYSESTIMNTLHDWTGDDNTMNQGKRTVLIVEKVS